MKRKLFVYSILLFVALLFAAPIRSLAVDYSITDVRIEAQLQQDGTVEVSELHTYDFDGEFNGIIRELVPKRGASIVNFKASEHPSKTPLKVERNYTEYRVHRKGSDETIQVELRYVIQHGIDKYEDGAELYWPFFDRRNESDYESMTITVVPPQSATDVLFTGYDSARGTGKLLEDGTVRFSLGRVNAGENGDVRVIYEPSLFPGMHGKDGLIRPVFLKEQQELEEKQKRFETNRMLMLTIGGGLLIVLSLLLAGVFRKAVNRRNLSIERARAELAQRPFGVPQQKLSMPATIFYVKSRLTSPELMAAALTDLVRKGHVRQLSDQEFQLVDRAAELPHEQTLIELLFDQIGEDGIFRLDRLDSFTKKAKNASAYQKATAAWAGQLKKELETMQLREDSSNIRLWTGGFGFAAVLLAILFAVYELWILMALAGIGAISAFVFAALYTPRSHEGHLLYEEWMQLQQWFKQMDLDEWKRFSPDDKFRALVFGVGMKVEHLESYFEAFVEADRKVGINRDGGDFVPYMNYGYMSGSFQQANSNVSASSGGGTSGGGGGGAGGGGGGSGAF